ncbi:MAG TPA: AbrB/MazE/SpoVT family DNA-binding domain-containing protein [Tepidisphaeraceae bacterium]|jgi:antitoxin MazE
MKAKLVRIGNSRGIRLPKAVIEQAGLRDANVELIVRDGEVVLRSPQTRARRKKNPRAGWDEQFRKAIARHGNELTDEDREWLDAPLDSEFDEKEWTW